MYSSKFLYFPQGLFKENSWVYDIIKPELSCINHCNLNDFAVVCLVIFSHYKTTKRKCKDQVLALS